MFSNSVTIMLVQPHLKTEVTNVVNNQPITWHVVTEQYWTLGDYVDTATTQGGMHISRCLPQLGLQVDERNNSSCSLL